MLSSYGEVQSHIRDNIGKAVKALNAATEDRNFALFRKLPEYADIVVKHKKADWIERCISEYKDLLTDCKVEYISANNIDVEKMVSDYFQQNPPFEAKKPDEFKDSIAAVAVNLDIETVFTEKTANPPCTLSTRVSYLRHCVAAPCGCKRSLAYA